VSRAAERHPEVAAKIERVRAERGERRGKRVREVELDAINDPSKPEMKQAFEEGYVEHMLNQSLSGGSLALFDLTFIDGSGGSGPDRLRVDTSTGLFWELDEGLLKDVFGGTDVLPSALSTLLLGQGISEQQFAQGALLLFN
jgi:hypothetical protein